MISLTRKKSFLDILIVNCKNPPVQYLIPVNTACNSECFMITDRETIWQRFEHDREKITGWATKGLINAVPSSDSNVASIEKILSPVHNYLVAGLMSRLPLLNDCSKEESWMTSTARSFHSRGCKEWWLNLNDCRAEIGGFTQKYFTEKDYCLDYNGNVHLCIFLVVWKFQL